MNTVPRYGIPTEILPSKIVQLKHGLFVDGKLVTKVARVRMSTQDDVSMANQWPGAEENPALRNAAFYARVVTFDGFGGSTTPEMILSLTSKDSGLIAKASVDADDLPLD